jgi:succinoglycan biosynthesis protein ExoO
MASTAAIPTFSRLENVVTGIDITFAIAAYNAAPFIEAAIRSVLSQTVSSVEIIVVDDDSTDSTVDVVRRLMAQTDRLRLIQSTRNSGPAASRNKALSAARGTWLAIVDADDLVLPERSRHLLDLAQSTGADIVADNVERFHNEGGQSVSTILQKYRQPYCFLIDATAYLQRNTMFTAEITLGYLKPMFRTSFLRNHGLTYSEDLWIGEDFDFCFRCLLAGARYVVTSDCFYRYRVWEGSLSWRLKAADAQRLIDAHRKTMAKGKNKGEDFTRAADRYVKALERARAFTVLIDSVKEHRWRDAANSILARIDLVPILGRSLYAHLSKKLARFIESRGRDGQNRDLHLYL